MPSGAYSGLRGLVSRWSRALALGLALGSGVAAGAWGQGLPAEVQRRLEGMLPGAAAAGLADTKAPSVLEAAPAAPAVKEPAKGSGKEAARPEAAAAEAALTRLEASYARRAGQAVRLFGYESFARPAGEGRQTGAIQEDYVLGPGDELAVTLYGRETRGLRLRVDREGRLLLPGLEPVPAAGLAFGAVRGRLEELVSASLPGTAAAVSLASIRQISVIVSGEVGAPGYAALNGLSTVMDGLVGAAGVTRGGSLRGVRLLRQGRVETVDLYPVLLGRAHAPLPNLAEGDVVNVPLLGRTAAVVGRVKRPAIYELPAGAGGLAAAALLELAGGPLVEGAHRYRLLRIGADGAERLLELSDLSGVTVGDGDVLFVEPAREATRGVVTLDGHVRLAGRQPLAAAPTAGRLLGGVENLAEQPYLPLAVRQYVDPRTQVLRFEAFDLGRVLSGGADVTLADGDRVIVLGLSDVAFLSSPAVVAALGGEGANDGCAGIAALARNVRANPEGELASGRFSAALRQLSGGAAACPAVFDRHPELLTFLIGESLVVRGNVLRPGVYPAVAGGEAAVLAVAGVLGGAAAEPAVTLVAARPPGAAAAGAAAGRIVEVEEARVILAGHVRDAGSRPLAAAPTLRALLGDARALREDPYTLFGVVTRLDAATLTRHFVPFSPARVLAGEADLALQARDEVRVFGFAEVGRLTAAAGRAADLPSGGPGDAAAAAGGGAEGVTAAAPGAGAAVTAAALGGGAGGVAAVPAVGGADAAAALARLLAEAAVRVTGEVRLPGLYPVAGEERLAAVLAAAGGLSLRADPAALEVTSGRVMPGEGRVQAERRVVDAGGSAGQTVALRAGDVVRVPPLGSIRDVGSVELAGEVWRPGRYELLSGERLSSVLARAGGLKPSAYPLGAVFTRAAVRAAERASYERVAARLNSHLAATLTSPSEGGKDPAQNVAMVRGLLVEMQGAAPLGRVVVEADPAVLQVRPELDLVLEGGDRLVIPSRPLHVMVAGEVLNPGAQQFASGATARAYVAAAGGTTQFADTARVYAILPNGQARPLGIAAWNASAEPIPPGSTIVVPRDLEPLKPLDLAGALADVLSKLAISAASLAVIGTR